MNLNSVRVSVIGAIAGLLLGGLAVAQDDEATAKEDISRYEKPGNLVDLVENGGREFIIVDVRTPREYRSGHIPGAVNIDHREINSQPPEVDKDTLIVTYCRSGARASRALATLERLGFDNVINFGGVSSWPGELVTGDQPR